MRISPKLRAWHRPCTVRNAALHVAPAAASRFYVWDYEQGARFLREFWDTAIGADPAAAASDQARRFPMCTAEGLRDLFAEVKLDDVSTQALDIVTRFTNFDDYWEPILKGAGLGAQLSRHA